MIFKFLSLSDLITPSVYLLLEYKHANNKAGKQENRKKNTQASGRIEEVVKEGV